MRIILAAALLLALTPALALAHDAHGHGGHSAVVEGGAPGKPAEATRTVTIVATDSAFAPKAVAVKAGETVRFIVRNDGKLVHELTIGTKAMQAEHQTEMLGFAVSGAIEADRIDRAKLGTHDHGNNVILEPGQTGEVVWTFAKTADLEFGCNIPGHYEAGMKGDFRFE
jgi:uncharacterized cupredoxin-like copper-binding protein